MRKFLIKILLKIVGENPFEISKIETEKMQEWLFDSFQNEGFKQYFTLRKKVIQNELTVGMEEKEYWQKLGRIDELRALSDNIKREVDRREKLKKK